MSGRRDRLEVRLEALIRDDGGCTGAFGEARSEITGVTLTIPPKTRPVAIRVPA